MKIACPEQICIENPLPGWCGGMGRKGGKNKMTLGAIIDNMETHAQQQCRLDPVIGIDARAHDVAFVITLAETVDYVCGHMSEPDCDMLLAACGARGHVIGPDVLRAAYDSYADHERIAREMIRARCGSYKTGDRTAERVS